MELTVTLPPEEQQWLQERAARAGQDTATMAAELLVRVSEWETQDREEALLGIQHGLDDFAAGRSRPFEQFANEQPILHVRHGAQHILGSDPEGGSP